MSLTAVQIRSEGQRVLVVKDGRAVFDMPWQAALDLSRGIHAMAKKSEEWSKKEQLIFDQGLLHRMGIRLGLIHNPVLRPEALKAAQRNDTLRRNLRNRIPADAASVGTPAVIRHHTPEVAHNV